MTYRHQIPACGWKAVVKQDDGSYSAIPLVCFEILCADEENEEDYSSYEPECEDINAKPKKGSAMEAGGFIGYLPPGESLEEWLNYNFLRIMVNPTTQEKTS
jgi:hypothetical protein